MIKIKLLSNNTEIMRNNTCVLYNNMYKYFDTLNSLI